MSQISPYADVLVATIMHLFPKGKPEVQGKVFAVTLAVTISDYSDDEEKDPVYRFLHLAVIAEMNYVQVYEAVTERPARWKEIDGWRFKCDHDSAWREDGVCSSFRNGFANATSEAERVFGKPIGKLSIHIAVDDMGIVEQSEVFPKGVPGKETRAVR